MAEITKVTTPMLPKESTANRLKPVSDQAYELTDPSKVHKSEQDGKAGNRQAEYNLLRESMGRPAIMPLLKNTNEMMQAFKKIAFLIETGVSASDAAKDASTRELLKSLFITPENFGKVLMEQDKSSVLFKGDAFDILRDVQDNFEKFPKVRDSLASLLKIFDYNVNSQGSIKTILYNCANILDYMFKKDREQFSTYLSDLAEMLLPEKEAKAFAGLRQPMQNPQELEQANQNQNAKQTGEKGQTTQSANTQQTQNTQQAQQDGTGKTQQTAVQQTTPQTQTGQTGPNANAGQTQNPSNTQQAPQEGQTGQTPQGENRAMPQAPGELPQQANPAQQGGQTQQAQQPQGAQQGQNAGQAQQEGQTEQVKQQAGQQPMPERAQAETRGQNQPQVSSGAYIAEKDTQQAKPAAHVPMQQLPPKEQAQILKNNLLPLLGEIVVKYHQNERIRDTVMVVVHNIVRVDQGTPESLDNAVTRLIDALEKIVNLPAGFEKQLQESVKQNIIDAKNTPNTVIEKLSQVVSNALTSPDTNPAVLRQAENMLISMLQNQSAVMDILHFVLPLDTALGQVFTEVYMDPETDEKVGRQKGKSHKIFISAESEAHGSFEFSFLETSEHVDFAMWCPNNLVKSLSGLKRNFADIMQMHGYTMDSFKVEEMREPHSVAEVFPRLMEKKVGIDVQV